MYSQETRQFMPKERTPPLFPSLLSHTHTRSLWRKSLPVRRKRFRKKNVLGKSGKKRWRNNSPLFGNICLNVANGTTIVIMYPNCPRPVRPVEKLFTLTRGKKKEKIWEEYPFLRLVFSWALITQQGRKKTESFLRLVCRWCGVTFRMHAQACLRFHRPDIYISSTISETLFNIMGGKRGVKKTLSKWIGRHHSGNDSMWRLSILWCQMMMGRRGRRFASAAVTLFQDFLFSACLINCADQKTHWNSTFPSSEKTPFPWKTVYITNEASKKQSPSLSLSRLPAVNSQTNRVLVWDLSWFAVLFLLLSTTQKRFFFFITSTEVTSCNGDYNTL